MPTEKSGITWFEDEEWIGSKVTFDHPLPSTWILVHKLREREKWDSQEAWERWETPSEPRGIFVCEKEGEPRRQAVLKIYMQIPFYRTIRKPRKIREKQARSEMSLRANEEISALQSLTDNGCSSAPSLLAWKHTFQDVERYVPGGYITYILMEKAPGINLEYFNLLPREERDQVRAAFKSAWRECIDCGFFHLDEANRNLIWDKDQHKCYLVDWEIWQKATPNDVWEDRIYLYWNLAQRGLDGDLHDMSTWTL